MLHLRRFFLFTRRSTQAVGTKRFARRLVLLVAILTIALGFQVRFAGPAFAYGVCGPSTQTTELQYTNMGCIYTSPKWFTQGYQQFAHIKLVFSGVSSKLVTDFTAGAKSWTTAGGFVDFSTSCSNCGNNVVTVTQITDCSQGWWGQGDSVAHTVVLNACYSSGSDTIWQGITAHELGHTMGLAHNRWNNGGSLMFGCDSPTQFSDCVIHVYTPQPVDVDILNTIFPVYGRLCSLTPNDANCNNQDYIVQSCNAFAQSPSVSDGNVRITLYYSTNCQSNWSWGQALNQAVTIVKEDIERQGNSVDVALTLTDQPDTSTWYTNMIWSPSNPARSCVWYIKTGPTIYGPVCTSWH